MIAFYNQHVGDVLMVVFANNQGKTLAFDKKDEIARVFTEAGNQTVAFNFFNASKKISLSNLTNGQIELDSSLLDALNQSLKSAGFQELLTESSQQPIVIAHVIKVEEHPDSDHLHVCQVDVGQQEPLQIVCGAPNVKAGMLTVAALPGSMMPDGTLIWHGKLRGVNSAGMLCSARELALPNAAEKRGIIELSAGIPGARFES